MYEKTIYCSDPIHISEVSQRAGQPHAQKEGAGHASSPPHPLLLSISCVRSLSLGLFNLSTGRLKRSERQSDLLGLSARNTFEKSVRNQASYTQLSKLTWSKVRWYFTLPLTPFTWTLQGDPLLLTSKHKLRYSTRSIYWNVTFVLMLTKPR